MSEILRRLQEEMEHTDEQMSSIMYSYWPSDSGKLARLLEKRAELRKLITAASKKRRENYKTGEET